MQHIEARQTQNNNIPHINTKHYKTQNNTQGHYNAFKLLYTECHYALCRYAECHLAKETYQNGN